MGGDDVEKGNCQPTDGCCGFFLQKKKRFCKLRPNAGQKFCPEHACAMGVQLERKRIPCPLDPKHTCCEDSLEKHLKKCNETVKKNRKEYYQENGINSGSNEGDTAPEPKVTVSCVSEEELHSLIDRVNKLYNENIGELESTILSHSCFKEELQNPTYGPQALRHRKQQASLIGHIDKLHLLKNGVCFVELGAGKGQLSHWIQKALENCDNVSFILVDRGTVRYKLDNQHREEQGPKFERLQIDLEHLNLGKHKTIAANTKYPIVAMGKHLCGAATDLALRCLTETLSNTEESESGLETPCKKAKTETVKRLPAGVVIALCCHHWCTWKAYVGKEFMRQCDLTSRDFQLLSCMSSWATCAWKGWRETDIKEQSKSESDKTEEESTDHTVEEHDVGDLSDTNAQGLRLTKEEREEVGRRCKRLIDYGRVRYLHQHNMESYLRIYIDHHLTPENVVLIATPKDETLINL